MAVLMANVIQLLSICRLCRSCFLCHAQFFFVLLVRRSWQSFVFLPTIVLLNCSFCFRIGGVSGGSLLGSLRSWICGTMLLIWFVAADVYFLTPCSFAGDAACVLGIFTFPLFGIRSAARFLLPLLWMCASATDVCFSACFLGDFCYFLCHVPLWVMLRNTTQHRWHHGERTVYD